MKKRVVRGEIMSVVDAGEMVPEGVCEKGGGVNTIHKEIESQESSESGAGKSHPSRGGETDELLCKSRRSIVLILL